MLKKSILLAIASLFVATTAFAYGHQAPKTHKSAALLKLQRRQIAKRKERERKERERALLLARARMAKASALRFKGWNVRKAPSAKQAKANRFKGWNVYKAPSPRRVVQARYTKVRFAKRTVHKPELHKKQRLNKRGWR